jgi:hypothetical protein
MADVSDIPIERLSTLELKDGDVLVMNVPDILSTEQRDHTTQMLDGVIARLGLSGRVHSLVLTRGCSLNVVRRAEWGGVEESRPG